MLVHQPLQGIDALALGSKSRIGRHTFLHCECIDRIELPIEIGMDRQRGFFVDHDWVLPMVSITWLRPRARRDITVPIGTLVTSAISRYDKPWTSRRIIVSRYAVGSAAMAACRQAASALAISAVSGVWRPGSPGVACAASTLSRSSTTRTADGRFL